jgi:hypothetical protein
MEPLPEKVAAHRDLVRDLKDVPVVLSAGKAQVDFLVSTDADLTDVGESTEKLRQMMAPGRVMKVGAFLSEIMGWDHNTLDAISRRRWDEIEGNIWGQPSEQQDSSA